MNTALAVAQIVIPLLPTLAGDVEKLIQWVASIRSVAKQMGQWTAEQESAFRASLELCGKDPAYLPDH